MDFGLRLSLPQLSDVAEQNHQSHLDLEFLVDLGTAALICAASHV